MTLITPDPVARDTEDLLTSVRASVRELRQELEGLKRRVRAGDDINATGDSKTVASANHLLMTCQKVEMSLAECRNKQAGIAHGGFALDLDKARADIGCKLDRLRCAGGAGRIPE